SSAGKIPGGGLRVSSLVFSGTKKAGVLAREKLPLPFQFREDGLELDALHAKPVNLPVHLDHHAQRVVRVHLGSRESQEPHRPSGGDQAPVSPEPLRTWWQIVRSIFRRRPAAARPVLPGSISARAPGARRTSKISGSGRGRTCAR